MKSTNPFDWKAQPSTLFTKQEKASMKQVAVVQDLKARGTHFYQKAIPNVFNKAIK
jgi:hypothetical protein